MRCLRSRSRNFSFSRFISMFVDYPRAFRPVERRNLTRIAHAKLTKRHVGAADARPAEYFI
jgi:hypothetical protein